MFLEENKYLEYTYDFLKLGPFYWTENYFFNHMYLQNTRHGYRQDLWSVVILMSKVQTDKMQNVMEKSVHII